MFNGSCQSEWTKDFKEKLDICTILKLLFVCLKGFAVKGWSHSASHGDQNQNYFVKIKELFCPGAESFLSYTWILRKMKVGLNPEMN